MSWQAEAHSSEDAAEAITMLMQGIAKGLIEMMSGEITGEFVSYFGGSGEGKMIKIHATFLTPEEQKIVVEASREAIKSGQMKYDGEHEL